MRTRITAIQGGKASKLPSQEEVIRSGEVEKTEDVYVTQQEESSLVSGKGTIVLKADRSLFGRRIITGQSRKIEVKDMLQRSLGPMPWALTSTAEVFPRKTKKAALAS